MLLGAVVYLESDFRHARGDDCAPNGEARLRCLPQIDPADVCDVSTEAHRRRATVEKAGLRRDVEALDDDVNDGAGPDASCAGIRDVLE